jgi:antitoxin component HigA of HigAB toxin-antitoxin module
VPPAHLRELLQQQIDTAGSWSELEQLLLGRRQVLTLKHLARMAQQVGVCCLLL